MKKDIQNNDFLSTTNDFFVELIEILEKNVSPETKWVRELPIYQCPTCKQDTIFKDGCLDCEEKND